MLRAHGAVGAIRGQKKVGRHERIAVPTQKNVLVRDGEVAVRLPVAVVATVAPYMIVLAIAIVMAAVGRTRGTIKMVVLYRDYLVDDNVNMAALIAGLSSILLRVLGIGHAFVGPAQTCAIFLLDSNRYGIPVSSAYSPHPKNKPLYEDIYQEGKLLLMYNGFFVRVLFIFTYIFCVICNFLVQGI